jgi:hypothetical protein
MDFEGCRKSMAGVRWPSSENGETLNSPTCTSRLHDRCIGSAIFIPIQYVLYQNRNRQRHSSWERKRLDATMDSGIVFGGKKGQALMPSDPLNSG